MIFTGIILIILMLVLAVVMFVLLKSAVKLVINSIIGLVILFLVNATGLISIPINLITVLVCAIGGIWGAIILILLKLVGITL